MNKTININLAGTFFHIDEDAYLKLQLYLESIKRSFTDSQGKNEIIEDIEARIAELFNERVQNERQVVRIKEVDDVISIMGQPEDYLVDDDIFEDEPQTTFQQKTTASKKLFRDTDNSYIGGVSSGLGHYIGLDSIWIRLIWILLLFGFGTGIFLYIILWILVPEAKTTTEKIMMMGEPVNITNIEKKIKDGFNTVSETVVGVAKNVSDAAKKTDFNKHGNNIKSSSKSFFDTLADIIMFFFKTISKLIGIILIIVGASGLIALTVGWLSVGLAEHVNIPGMDFINIVNAGDTPIWLASLLVFFLVGIPFFFLFYLGLKIVINNLKSIGNIAKYTLLGIWFFSIIALIILGIKEVSENAYTEYVTDKQELIFTTKDTLQIKMLENDIVKNHKYKYNSFKIATNSKGEKTIYSSDIDIIIKPTSDSIATISIEKNADGSNYEKAIKRAKNITYNYTFQANQLVLDTYFSTHSNNKFSNQEVKVVLFLPENTVVKFENNTKHYLGSGIPSNYVNHYLNITQNGVICNDCIDDEFEVDIDMPNVKIDKNGIEIKADNNQIKINNDGINIDAEAVKVKINNEGVNVNSNK